MRRGWHHRWLDCGLLHLLSSLLGELGAASGKRRTEGHSRRRGLAGRVTSLNATGRLFVVWRQQQNNNCDSTHEIYNREFCNFLCFVYLTHSRGGRPEVSFIIHSALSRLVASRRVVFCGCRQLFPLPPVAFGVPSQPSPAQSGPQWLSWRPEDRHWKRGNLINFCCGPRAAGGTIQ